MTAEPRLGVVFDEGAATIQDVVAATRGLAEPVFLAPDTPFNRTMAPMLGALGAVDADIRSARAAGLAGVLTYSETQLTLTCRLATELGLPFHRPRTVEQLTSKLAQRRSLAAAGVETVRVARIDRVGDWPAAVAQVGLPLVLKPCRGQSSAHTHLIEDTRAGERLVRLILAESPPGTVLLAEEFLAGLDCAPLGDYVSVESVVQDGHPVHIAVTGKLPLARPFRETGQFWPAALTKSNQDAVRARTSAAIRALGVRDGVTHTELKLTAGGPRLIEVNGRLGGNINELSLRAGGPDLARAAASIALSRPVVVAPHTPDRVHFQLTHPAPDRVGELVRVTGVERVRAHPAVRRYVPRMRPGDRLTGAVATRNVDLICGDAATVPEMVTAVAELAALSGYVFDTPDGRVTLTGAQLAQWLPG
ncbi:ATP-grasp domain-containing protein [Paractinoplanes rishiriensis]|uniref:ATP-grasp domain-containing protein n=1 Tax=Paractinoplanes rishiriensis TaxID=1050105 RepID=UPI001945B76A|nr:ATP-grasp domain-containing protein [Actinoplanes rishiriensis]